MTYTLAQLRAFTAAAAQVERDRIAEFAVATRMAMAAPAMQVATITGTRPAIIAMDAMRSAIWAATSASIAGATADIIAAAATDRQG